MKYFHFHDVWQLSVLKSQKLIESGENTMTHEHKYAQFRSEQSLTFVVTFFLSEVDITKIV